LVCGILFRVVVSAYKNKEKFVNKFFALLLIISMSGVVGCASIPAKSVKSMQLGMTPGEVTDVMGKPNTIRASKVFEDGQIDTVWEYSPAWFEINPKTFWVTFRNDRVVQWGEPGDWAGKSGKTVPVEDYKPGTVKR
jgi:hypothetical protein